MALIWTDCDSTLAGLEDGGRGAEPQKLGWGAMWPRRLTNSTRETLSLAWLQNYLAEGPRTLIPVQPTAHAASPCAPTSSAPWDSDRVWEASHITTLRQT